MVLFVCVAPHVHVAVLILKHMSFVESARALQNTHTGPFIYIIYFNFEVVVTFDHAPTSRSIHQTDGFFSASAENGCGTSQLAAGRNGSQSPFNVCEILACLRWVWWGVLSEFAETKNNCSACNAKSKGGRTKNST